MGRNVLRLSSLCLLVWGAAAGAAPAEHSPQPAGYAAAVKRCLPAVVNVSSSKIVSSADDNPLLADPSFRQFFGQFSKDLESPHREREQNVGSGVIVRPDGYILTNEHVVSGAAHVKVALADHREFEARIVGADPHTDIAVLKVDATGLPAIPIGDSSKMAPGDVVLAIGNPFGLSQTVTMGIVSAVGRANLGIEDYEDFIQTDAAINPGNSGGALIDSSGELIGINTAILSGAGGNQGVGFAIPINMAHEVMDQIVKNGRVVRAWLGLTAQPVTPGLAAAFGVPGEPHGALVGDVTPRSPAAAAGLASGDVILDMNGQPVPDSGDLSWKIAMAAPGTTIRLRVLRNGSQRDVTVPLTELPAKPQEQHDSSADRAAPSGLMDGVDVAPLTASFARELRLPTGAAGVVVTNIGPASLASEGGLKRGDIIIEVNRKPVANTTQFQNFIRTAGAKAMLLRVMRKGATRYLVIEPE